MFGRSKLPFTHTGSLRRRDLIIAASTSGGDEAVSAMKGTDVKARSPPILSKSLRKSLPLSQTVLVQN